MRTHLLAFALQIDHLFQVKVNALTVQLLRDGTNKAKLAIIAELDKLKMLMECVNAQEIILLTMESNVCLAQMICPFGMDINALHVQLEPITTLDQKPAQFVHRDWCTFLQLENVKLSSDYSKIR